MLHMLQSRRAGSMLLVIAASVGLGILAARPASGTPVSPAAHDVYSRLESSVSAMSADASSARPGATDPMGTNSRFYLVKFDELWVPSYSGPTAAVYPKNVYNVDTSLNISHRIENQTPSYLPSQSWDTQIFADSGRFTTSEFDQIVQVYRAESTTLPASKTMVTVSDKTDFEPAGQQETELYFNGPANLVNRVYGQDLLDISAGDLDRQTDAQGHFHDEAVVANAEGGSGSSYPVGVTVIDFTRFPPGQTTVQLSHSIDQFGASSWSGNQFQGNVLAVTNGDFDGDGAAEIAVAVIQNSTAAWLSILRYSTDAAGNHSLAEVSSTQLALDTGTLESLTVPSVAFVGSAALKAGDFDGDGNDELVWASVQCGGTCGPTQGQYIGVFADTVAVSATLAATKISSTWVDDTSCSSQFPCYLTRVEIAPGLFHFDPGSGFDFTRRQFAVAWNMYGFFGMDVNLATYSVDTNLKMTNMAQEAVQPGVDNYNFSLAAGSFRGLTTTSPIWSLAVKWIGKADGSLYNMVAVYGDVETLGAPSWLDIDPWSASVAPSDPNKIVNPHMPLVAFDYDGDSVYLGAPVHLTIEGAVRTDFIVQEPPKHAYYDNNPNSPTNTYGQVVSVSRSDSFNVAMQDDRNTSYQGTSKDTADRSTGMSVAGSASLTVNTGGDIGIANADEQFTLQLKNTSSWDWNEHESSYNSSLSNRQITVAGNTSEQDYIRGRHQAFDIWRYRIYGSITTPPPNNGYYEIVLPGPWQAFDGTALQDSWYQPIYENGNILSYPSKIGTDNVNPSDLGVYADPQGTPVAAPLIPVSERYFGGTGGSVLLQYGNTSQSGSDSTYGKSFADNFDMKITNKVSFSVLGTGMSSTQSLKYGYRKSSSTTNTIGSVETTSAGTGITLSQPDGADSMGYQFFPVFYITKDGTLKVSHAARIPDSGPSQPFWHGLYGGPDPALNLPVRFNPYQSSTSTSYIGWQPNPVDSRKLLRGFFLLDAQPDGSSDYLVYDPVVGDKLTIQTRVYNYSVGTPIADGQLEVQFQAIPYDSDLDKETKFSKCPPANSAPTAEGRCVIGALRLGPIGVAGAGNVITATLQAWDTTGYGPSATTSATGEYRIYVVLDPNNTIPNETYETEDPTKSYLWVDPQGNRTMLQGIDPGQNNEGYGEVRVLAGTTTFAAADHLADVHFMADSLAVRDARDQSINSRDPVALRGRPTRVRVKLYSKPAQRESNHVLLYDGDPASGGVLIGTRPVFSGDPNGASTWFDWQPRTAGAHTLYARVFQDQDDPVTENGEARLTVQVVTSLPPSGIYLPSVVRP